MASKASLFFHKRYLQNIMHSIKHCRSQSNQKFQLLQDQIIQQLSAPLKKYLENGGHSFKVGLTFPHIIKTWRQVGKIKHETLQKMQYFLHKYFDFPHQELFLSQVKQDWQRSSSLLKIANNYLTAKCEEIQNPIKEEEFLFKNFPINCFFNQQLFTADKILLTKQYHEKLKDAICQLMNNSSFGAALFIGLDDERCVRGLPFEPSEKENIAKNVYLIRKNFIFPALSENQQVFCIHFIKVKDFGSDEDKVMVEKQKFVLKIFADTKGNKNSYFRKETDGKKKQKYFYVNQYHKEFNIFPQMLNKFKKKNRQFANILIKQNPYLYFDNMIEAEIKGQYIQKKEKKIFGKEPKKRYQYQSIIVFCGQSQNLLKKFLQFIGDQYSLPDYYEVYDRLKKIITNHKVYYISHEQNPEQLWFTALKLDPNRKNLIFYTIKSQLLFMEFKDLYKALTLLRRQFSKFTDEKYDIFWKQQKSGGLQYFIKFESVRSSIFAMVLLQYNLIRTRFVSCQRMKQSFGIKHLKSYQKYIPIFSKIEPFLEQNS